jgi:prepilin-type N-terminal cleavage/methylation domain-containing protein
MRRTRQSSGFTLLEILVALTILGIGLLSLAAMQLVAMEYGARGRHLTKAAAVAEEQMEILARRRWTDIAPTGGFTAPEARNEVIQGPTNEVEQAYAVSWRIADVEPTRTRSIEVLVQWSEPGRPNHQYAISTLRFNHEKL